MTTTFGYNPASQLATKSRSNDAYAWTGVAGSENVERSYAVNGLNQYKDAGGPAFSYDANGNLKSDGTTTFGYDIENRLVTATGAKTATLRYDPLGRLYEVVSGTTTDRFLYDGDALVAEYDGTGNLTDRYVHGADAGADDPLVWYPTGQPAKFLHRDHQGSIVALATGPDGSPSAINAYDEYGIPKAGNIAATGTGNTGRFQYTGQIWLGELGLYHYKARAYSPPLGRFLQTDPVGYDGGMNIYAYVGNDPVNGIDPSGMMCTGTNIGGCDGGLAPGASGTSTGSVSGNGSFNSALKQSVNATPPGGQPQNDQGVANDIVVTARRTAQTLGRAATITIDAVQQAFYSVDDALDIVHNVIFPPACCFTAGTPVSTPAGLKTIETLKVGDLVISRNDKTGETAAKPVVSITPAHERRIWTVIVSYKDDDGRSRDERYETTDDHPWRTANGYWATSASLKHGQALARENGVAVVAAVADTGKAKLTYNLEIADFHSYFVGKARTWVHNSCGYVFKTSHYAPRLQRAGVNVQNAESAVRAALEAGGARNGSVVVNGQTLLYRSFVLPGGEVSVGTIHIPW